MKLLIYFVDLCVKSKSIIKIAIPLNPLIEQFAERVCKKNTKTANHWKITDEVFLLIERETDLLKEYDRLMLAYSKKTVNQQIGFIVKRFYNLQNDKSREKHPKSKLIKSHKRFR